MTNIIKLRYTKDGEPHGREYSYLTPVPVEVGDLVEIETNGKPAKGIITQIEVPESEIAPFKDKVKTILGKVKTPQELIESILPLQEQWDLNKGDHPCPRCGQYTMKYPAVKNALSRRVDAYICSQCGTEEAMLDAARREPLPLDEWAVVKRYRNNR